MKLFYTIFFIKSIKNYVIFINLCYNQFMQKKSTIWIYILVVFLILSLFFGGIYYYFLREKFAIETFEEITRNEQSEKFSSCTIFDSNQTKELTENWVVYENEYVSFMHPDQWTITTNTSDLIIFQDSSQSDKKNETEFAVRINEMSNLGLEEFDLVENKKNQVGCALSDQTILKSANSDILIANSFYEKGNKYLLTFYYRDINQKHSQDLQEIHDLIIKTFEFK